MKRYVKAAVNLYKDADTLSRFEVAREISSERMLRDIAATEQDATVLMALAYNKNTPADILLDLVHKGNDRISQYALRNPNASTELIDTLYNSPFSDRDYARQYIDRMAADSNVLTDQNFLRKCAQSSIPHIRGLVAGNAAAAEDVQNMLVDDTNVEVLWELVNNSLVYKSCLEKLAQNTDEDIRQQAVSRLAEGDYLV